MKTAVRVRTVPTLTRTDTSWIDWPDAARAVEWVTSELAALTALAQVFAEERRAETRAGARREG